MNFELISNRLGGVCPAGSDEFEPMDEAEIQSIERRIHADLPEAYRSLLLTFGAFTFHGRSENNPQIRFRSITPLPYYITPSEFADIDGFYGRTADTGPSGLLEEIEYFEDRIPDTMIPIADDGGAGQICLGVKESDRGKMFYWDMRGEPLDEETFFEDYGKPMPPEAKRANVYLMAHSFEEFLDQLVLASIDLEL
jgi:hypothetical protein